MALESLNRISEEDKKGSDCRSPLLPHSLVVGGEWNAQHQQAHSSKIQRKARKRAYPLTKQSMKRESSNPVSAPKSHGYVCQGRHANVLK